MEFLSKVETARFHNPLQGGAVVEQVLQRRWDPLTSRTCVVGEGLQEKVQLFVGTTDQELLTTLVNASRQGCLFCPERVDAVTPRYEEALIAGGRKRSGRAVLFPNLFPLAKIHAVITIPEEHFGALNRFSQEMIGDFLRVGLAFTHDLARHDNQLSFVSINANHLPPAGASIVHPHFQVYGSEAPPGLIGDEIARAEAYLTATGNKYWEQLVVRERQLDERYIGETAGVHWLTPFCPMGSNEVIGIVPGTTTMLDLTDEQLTGLAKGMTTILHYYASLSLCSFNASLTSGLLDGSSPGSTVRLRIISRQNFYANYRNDEYFLQKLLGEELVITPPEIIAQHLRLKFGQLTSKNS